MNDRRFHSYTSTTLTLGKGVVFAYQTLVSRWTPGPYASTSTANESRVWRLDLDTLSWHLIPTVERETERKGKTLRTPSARLDPVISCISGTLVLMGGKSTHTHVHLMLSPPRGETPDPDTETCVSTSDYLDTETGAWRTS
ncbi:hypothetical protein KIPB_010982 [Kipferlia bialata]|uniref:Kelch-type beta propeller n=1 Tax=Kipferlia bialata TaxID=797122 RepID=A0A391NUG5_9EUKA|nr:hypothetical protein KIPB_010982 [Kipferlia bialata]|eukprot:g10982.t1